MSTSNPMMESGGGKGAAGDRGATNEVEPLLAPNRESTDADAALAMRIAELEARRYRAEEAEANARAWEAHNSRPNPYYYGTWRGPAGRPLIMYRDIEDPRAELYTFLCFFLWVSILLYIIIVLSNSY